MRSKTMYGCDGRSIQEMGASALISRKRLGPNILIQMCGVKFQSVLEYSPRQCQPDADRMSKNLSCMTEAEAKFELTASLEVFSMTPYDHRPDLRSRCSSTIRMQIDSPDADLPSRWRLPTSDPSPHNSFLFLPLQFSEGGSSLNPIPAQGRAPSHKAAAGEAAEVAWLMGGEEDSGGQVAGAEGMGLSDPYAAQGTGGGGRKGERLDEEWRPINVSKK